MEQLIRNVYWEGKGAALPFEKGIISGSRSVRQLCDDLRNRGYKYVLTSRLNQDVVENFFPALGVWGVDLTFTLTAFKLYSVQK